MGMTQIPRGRLHVPGIDAAADQGRGDALPVQGLLSYHDAGQIPLLAILPQLLGISHSSMAEAEIVTANKTRGTKLQQLFQKSFPRLAHGFGIDLQGMDIADAIVLQEPLPICFGAQEHRRCILKQGLGMSIKGDGGRLRIQLLCQMAANPKQGLMAQMNPVKKTQGKNPLGTAHIITPF
jgi:hypothetical protein